MVRVGIGPISLQWLHLFRLLMGPQETGQIREAGVDQVTPDFKNSIRIF
jgi:hypothetical protein